MSNNYTVFHLHSSYSLLDSATAYNDYVDYAKSLDMTTIGSSEHGNLYNWVSKRLYTEKQGLKYLHSCEVYITKTHDIKERDNYHTILIAKNDDGIKELNTLVSLSTQESHMYYKNRISIEEFLKITDNIIKISACLASPLNHYNDIDKKLYDRICRHYNYYEIQYHNDSKEEQKIYNKYLYELSKQYNKPLIASGDTHSLNKYKAECRSILQKAKGIQYANEDEFDLTFKTYNEFVDMFKIQDSLPIDIILNAIENTNIMANSVEYSPIDMSFKYPVVSNDDENDLKKLINKKYKEKITKGIIEKNPRYIESIKEEMRVFKKLNMLGFMLFMGQMCIWCKENNIPIGTCRGSVGGSVIAYIIDIIDVNPIRWNTVFSRFCNETRTELGDIDLDFAPNDREKVYNYIIHRFGRDKATYILSLGTITDKATIDEIGRALDLNLDVVKTIKKEYDINPDKARKDYLNVFYYFDGMLNTIVSQGLHPAGMVCSCITLPDNYGILTKDNKDILQINMEDVHECGLVKYDILGLKNIGIIRDACAYAGLPYPESHNINWEDNKVWEDIPTSSVGCFQFESPYAFSLLKQYTPTTINSLSIVNASLRPSGASYRDRLLSHEKNNNPSELIDDLLKDNAGFLIFQEDTLKFLQQICGLSGSEADNVRRAIGRKQKDRLDKAMPEILEGYCKKSDKPREIAEQEAKQFLQIIEDSSNYQFGYNHSTGYSMIGYLCMYYRYYYPLEFICSYLNNASNEDDIKDGTNLAKQKGINLSSPKFRYSNNQYTLDKKTNTIFKGVSSIKGISKNVGEQLNQLKNNIYDTFLDLLCDLKPNHIHISDILILIKLNYFSEFGKIKKLLKYMDIFQQFFNAKTFNKGKSYLVKFLVIKKFCDKETAKQYKEFRDIEFLNYTWSKLPDEDISTKEKIKYELEYYGYIDTIDETIDDRLWCVISTELRGNNYITHLQNINNGKQETCKIRKRIYQDNKIEKSDFILLRGFSSEGVRFKDGEEWKQSTDIFENILKEYKKI